MFLPVFETVIKLLDILGEFDSIGDMNNEVHLLPQSTLR